MSKGFTFKNEIMGTVGGAFPDTIKVDDVFVGSTRTSEPAAALEGISYIGWYRRGF